MPDVWSKKKKSPDHQNPYVHWWTEKDGAGRIVNAQNPDGEFLPRDFDPAEIYPDRSGGRGADGRSQYVVGLGVPVPRESYNTEEHVTAWNSDQVIEQLPDDVPPETVIVGIVDTGIALGHSRFRRRDHSTRFIASWQQTAEYQGQDFLPCGQELYAGRINDLLAEHSGGARAGRLDEEAFNRAAHLVEPHLQYGQRDLDFRGSHGTHVLDLAAGMDQALTEAETLDRHRIIAVNLPPQYIHGSAGNFLAYFAGFAVERILFLADALWEKINPNAPADAVRGYPIVINFSYGMQAGPKDGTLHFESAFKHILEKRFQINRGLVSPVRLVMPAGNENLERGAASIVLGAKNSELNGYKAKQEVKLPWRIKPSDATSNFVEIWTSADIPENKIDDALKKLKLSVTPPGRAELPVGQLSVGYHFDLGDYARIYCEAHDVSVKQDRSAMRIHCVICVAPTLTYHAGVPNAPAGAWSIRVGYTYRDAVDFSFYIQSDQSGSRSSKTGLRSYFDEENYETHLENGSTRDTFAYGPGPENGNDLENWLRFGPVQRKGTHNALASSDDLICIGGYRESDGAPAVYSATADGDRTKKGGRAAISASYPSESGAAHFGLLAAGAKDGCVVAFRGTSMATGLATRDIVEAFDEWRASGADPGSELGGQNWLRDRAAAQEREISRGITDSSGAPSEWPRIRKLKSGVGRLPFPESAIAGRVHRFGIE